MQILSLLPAWDLNYQGPALPRYYLIAYSAMGFLRSLVHLLSPDGGAFRIARLRREAGASQQNLIAIFAQWGALQLLESLILWTILLRYPALIPAGLGIVCFELLLRWLAGYFKPFDAEAPPPGRLGTKLLLPISLWALWASLNP